MISYFFADTVVTGIAVIAFLIFVPTSFSGAHTHSLELG